MKSIRINVIISSLVYGVSLLFVFSCNKEGADNGIKMYVTARNGLLIRAEADTNSSKLGLVPYGKQVEVHKQSQNTMTIDGKTGHWTRISYNGITGWSFGGYLSANPPGATQSSIEGEFINKDLICLGSHGVPRRYYFSGSQLEITFPDEDPESYNWSFQNGVLSYGDEQYFLKKTQRGLLLQSDPDQQSQADLLCPEEFTKPRFDELWQEHLEAMEQSM